jgi:hypothetical protein
MANNNGLAPFDREFVELAKYLTEQVSLNGLFQLSFVIL